MNRVEFAQALASFAHDGQTDKGGKPYIEHPMAVAAEENQTTPERIRKMRSGFYFARKEHEYEEGNG